MSRLISALCFQLQNLHNQRTISTGYNIVKRHRSVKLNGNWSVRRCEKYQLCPGIVKPAIGSKAAGIGSWISLGSLWPLQSDGALRALWRTFRTLRALWAGGILGRRRSSRARRAGSGRIRGWAARGAV